ncbi:hypothetical protein SK128_009829 [Halocaridina rubra]|uniref:SET and MYND domain-containing protein 4 n=1 Tax=Halocaridina rubra TaxID=373956 RepID=A0AAN9AH51_HALRR
MMKGREQPGSGASETDFLKYLQTLCSDETLYNRKEGFFTHFIEQIDEQVSDSFFNKFGKLKTDEERILDTWAIKPVHTLKIQSFYKAKDSDMAEYFRKKGNAAFQNKENMEALVMYSRAVMKAPYNSEDCLSLSYANRSAVLYHVGEYQHSLNDIDMAFEAAYPTDLMYKVLDRRGQCYTKLGLYTKAFEAFQASERALSDSTLEEKKMASWRNDLKKKMQLCQGKTDKVQTSCSSESDDRVFAGASPILPNASTVVALKESNEAGRYAVVTRPVGTGQVLISENPYASVIPMERFGTHCLQCSTRLVAPVACKWCSSIAFCSASCRDAALGTYHKWECKFIDLLTGSGMSLNCFLALRIITQHDLQYFKDLEPLLHRPASLPSEKEPHRPHNYISIYNMVSLEEHRGPEDFLERSLMACFLLKVLQRADFFGRWDEDEGPPDRDLTEDELFIGSLLLKNLQVLQFNSHEISSIGYDKDKVNFKAIRNMSLGLAVYPTASFCNHSCYPAVARYFNGRKMVVINIRPLQAGDILAENYGPIFTHHDMQTRHRKLLSRYWFRCTCEACQGDWPTYNNMSAKRKLRCQTCAKGLVLVDPKKIQVKCPSCNTQNNVQECLAIITKADDSYVSAQMHMTSGQREEAIKTLTWYVDTLCKLTVPPIRELHQAMESLRLLFAARGTVQVRNPLKI